jgi:hypothetical protein
MSTLKIRDTVHYVVVMLVAGDYVGVEGASRGRRLTAEQLRQAVEEYGRELRMPPELVFDDLDVVEIEGAAPRAWSALVDLWTDTGGELYDIEIYDLHVL